MAKSAKKVAKKASKKAPAKKAAPKKAAPKKKAAKKANVGLLKQVTPSATLAEIVGAKPLPRTEIIKKIWDHIKKNNLQDAKNRRMINADAKLKDLFGGKKQVSMFDLAKLVSNHVK